MVDLPEIKNVTPQVQAPQSRVSPGQIASPYMELAANLDKAAKETGDVSQILAKDAGLKAVTRDENGNVQVERLPIVGPAAITYRNAVTLKAAADGESVAKNDFIDIRKQHENDPEAFRIAAEAYKKDKVPLYEKAAGPEVGLLLGKTIDGLATENYKSLLNKKETLDLHASYNSIQAQIETKKNELFAIAAGGDQSSPEFTRRLQDVGALYGQLVSNPRMAVPQARVDFELSQLRSELDVSGMDNKIAKIQAEQGPEAAMAEADKIKSDPSLNLSPGQRLNYSSRLIGGIQQRVNAQNAVDRSVAGEIGGLNKIIEQGYSPTPNTMAAVRTAVIASKNPALVGALQAAEATQPIIADWRKSSPAQLERNLAEVDRVMREKGATPESIALKDTGEKLLANMRAGIKADPLGWANRTGAVSVPPLDFSQPNISEQMRNRTAAAETVAAHYGIASAYLTPDERSAISAATAQGGKPMTDVAAALVDGFGDRAPRVMSEISKDAPVLAHMGGLINMQGSQAVVRDAAEAVRLRQDKEFKLPHWLDKPSDKILAAQHQRTVDTYGSAFVLAPDTARAAEATAQAAFFARSARNGYDPLFESGDTSGSKKAYDRALQESAGATFDSHGVQYGGVGQYRTGVLPWGGKQVLVPGNVRADRFGDVIGAIKDEDLGGKWQAFGRTYGVSDLQKATPVAVKGGYRFSAGDPNSDDPKWIPDANGRPLTVGLDQLEPALRKRVPQAYVGQ